MRLYNFLDEALRPSQYRQYVKNWDKTRYAKLFNDKYRIYLNLGKSKENNYINPLIKSKLEELGYEIENYVAGLCKKKDGKNLIKIGKILQKEAPELLKKFTNDPLRSSSKKELLVVISRHPYDIAGMSTDRGWTSCMDLKNIYTKDGKMCRYIKYEVNAGSIVAYLINNDDKNINNPIARITIKPYINMDDPNDVLLVPGPTYGSPNPGFRETVVEWLDSFQHSKVGEFKIHNAIYPDKMRNTILKGDIFSIKRYQWLKDWLDIESNPQTLVTKDGNTVMVRNGVWKNGTWKYGTFKDGLWKNGTFLDGNFINSTWNTGTFHKGEFINSIWHDGVFKSGSFKMSTWKDGIWLTGRFVQGIWYNGVWGDGVCEFSTWENGTWKDGTWYIGTWKNGIWENGLWASGTWLDGIWKKGFIQSRKYTFRYVESSVNPNKFYELEKESKTLEELKEMVK